MLGKQLLIETKISVLTQKLRTASRFKLHIYSVFLEYFDYLLPNDAVMGTWTEFKLEGLFVNWAAVIISNVSAYMTVFINTVYFHIS